MTTVHEPFTDVTEPLTPKWLPALDIDPDWHIDTGEFPHQQDPALRSTEEET